MGSAHHPFALKKLITACTRKAWEGHQHTAGLGDHEGEAHALPLLIVFQTWAFQGQGLALMLWRHMNAGRASETERPGARVLKATSTLGRI